MRLGAEDCLAMLKVNNKLLIAQAEDDLRDLNEEFMNFKHKHQIPYPFKGFSKNEYRFFLRGQIYATCRFMELIDIQYAQTLYGD